VPNVDLVNKNGPPHRTVSSAATPVQFGSSLMLPWKCSVVGVAGGGVGNAIGVHDPLIPLIV
jgi:hypothetical protein